MKNTKGVHMRQCLFLYYGWFLQNLERGCIRTNMHTTVRVIIILVIITQRSEHLRFSSIIFCLKPVCTVSVCPTLYTTYMQASASVLRIMRVTELFRIHTCDYARVPFLRCIVCTRLNDDDQPCHIGLRLSGANF